MTKAIYRRKSLLRVYSSRGIRVHHGKSAWQHLADILPRVRAGSPYIFNYKQEIARINLKWCKSFETTNSIPNDILPLARSHYITLTKQPPTRDRVFKLHGPMWNILTQMATNALFFITTIHWLPSLPRA